MKKNVVRILTAVLMLSVVFSSSVFAAEKEQSAWDAFVGFVTGNAITAEDTQVDGVTYRTHIQNDGWAQGWVSDGETSGSYGRSLRLEGIEIKIDGDTLPDGLGVTYRTQIENDGWLEWETDGDTSGSVGKGLRLEGIEIKLTGDNASDYSVRYKTHIQNKGWETDWKYDGELSGTVGEWLRLEGIQIEIVQKTADLTAYNAALAAVTKADYTAASWTTYQAVVNANVVDEDNLQSEVDAATEAITAAQANLVLVPKVTSVTAINATQVVVTFNSALDKTDAQTAAKYAIGANNPATAVLSTDAKSVTLTFSAANQVEVTDAVFVVNPIKTAVDTTLLTQKYTQVFTYNDTVKPEITSVTSATKGSLASSVTVKASEPIASATAKIDGTSVAINFNNTNEAVITGLSLDATTTHTLEVINLVDRSANANTTVYTSKTFSITSDTVAPTVALSAKTDRQILVTFSKPMNVATVAAAFGANAGVKDETLATVNTLAVTTAVADTNDTQFIIVTNQTLFANTATRTLNVVFPATILDTLGNPMVATTKSVTLTKDTVKPAFTSYRIIKDATDKVTSIEFNFSEGLLNNANPAEPTIVNENGVDVTATFLGGLTANAITAGDTKVTYVPATPAKVSGSFAFSFAKDLVTDQSEAANKSDAFNTTINFGANAGTFTLTSAASTSATSNVIAVDFGRAVKGGAVANSATDAARYTLSGKALPSGTTITLDATQNVATITLPAQSIPTTDGAAVFTVANVTALDNSTLTTFAGTVQVADNTDPTLTATALNSDGTITATFSEDLQTAPAVDPVVTDIVVTVNGSVLVDTGAAVAYTIAPITSGADNGKYLVTVSSSLDTTGALPADDFTYIDVDADGTYSAGDIKLVTGTGVAAGTVNLKTSPAISTVKLGTLVTGTSTAADAAGNPLAINVVKTVK